MKELRIRLGLWVVLLVSVSCSMAFDYPDTYPTVPLLPGSDPRYVVLAMDPWTNQVAYVMFDGGVKKGYDRIYVWIPGSVRYNKPVSFLTTDKEKTKFASFSETTSTNREMCTATYTLSWGRQRAGTHFDYYTGKTINVSEAESERSAWPVFFFTVDYARGPKMVAAAGGMPLDVTIYGQFIYGCNPGTGMTNLPPVFAPWNHLVYYMQVTNSYGKEDAMVHFKGVLNYQHFWNAVTTVRALPKDTEITLTVSPYLEAAVYSRTQAVGQVFSEGLTMPLPFGWYDLDWKMTCQGLGIVARTDWYVVMTPFPVVPKPMGL